VPGSSVVTADAGREQVVRDLLARPWDELETLEHAGYLLFPAELRRRKRDGTFETVPVALRVPREHETRAARIQARRWAAEEGLDPRLDPDLFDNLDSLCVLAIAIRNATPPHEPWEPDVKQLEKKYDRVSLDALWSELEAVRKVLDPRPDTITEDTFVALVGAIAQKNRIDPLAALGGDGQARFVVRMASLLWSYLKPKS